VGALLNLLFQAGMRLLQLACHGIELMGEGLELVPGLDGNALGEITAAQAGGAAPQGLDRADHSASKEHPGEDGKTQRSQKHEPQTLQRRVERRIGLLGRQLTSSERRALARVQLSMSDW
jgi:hypothetical protein